MKAIVCDGCDKIIKFDLSEITKVKVRGNQNYNKHYCKDCFSVITSVLTKEL